MEQVLYEARGPVRLMTLNRPEQLNALSYRMEELMEAYLAEFQSDESAQVLVVCGSGRAFCAGLDLKGRSGAFGGDASTQPRGLFGPYAQEIFKPVIAALHGYAVGAGLELGLACDIRIAAEGTRMGFPEAKRGLMPGMGGTQLLPRSVPLGQAMYMLLTGDLVEAAEAWRWGLVQQVVAPEQLLDTAVALGERMAKQAPLSLRAIKEAVVRGLDLDRRGALLLERHYCFRVAATEDFAEGIRAFAEKRDPRFTGR